MPENGTVSGGKVWSPPPPANNVPPSPPAKTKQEERKEKNWVTAILAMHMILPMIIIPSACLYYGYTRPLFAMEDPSIAEELWSGEKAESIEPFFFFPIFSTLLYAIFLVFLVCVRKRVRAIVDNYWDPIRQVMWVTQALMAMALFSISIISFGNSYTEKYPVTWAEHYYGYELLEETTGEQDTIKVRESDGVESIVSIHQTDEGLLLYKDEAHLLTQLSGISKNIESE